MNDNNNGNNDNQSSGIFEDIVEQMKNVFSRDRRSVPPEDIEYNALRAYEAGRMLGELSKHHHPKGRARLIGVDMPDEDPEAGTLLSGACTRSDVSKADDFARAFIACGGPDVIQFDSSFKMEDLDDYPEVKECIIKSMRGDGMHG